MALSAEAIEVATTATLIATADSDGEAITVRNTGAADVFIGAPDVTTAAGFTLSAGEVIGFDLEGGASVYGICAADTVAVRVLRHRS